MIIYRPHKGGLAESLAEAREFETEEEMKRHIYEHHKTFYRELGYENAPFEVDDIEIDWERPIEDERIGWHDSMYVCAKRYGGRDYIKEFGASQCIGMCATDYEKGNI